MNRNRRSFFETLERREVFAPLPVLMVIADQRDFFYQEYGDTRQSLVEAGLTVRVAARTTNPSTPHPNSGQGSSSGVVTPDLPLSAVNSADYSAIVFVGGWGSSMYQYAFTGNYYDDHYDGNASTI
ncbi:DJ-1/PfpI family protein [Anatilimnocola floriformis]|uniref:DJ-1/PfpI family protein n=1 Tax=Anatilimnocola floriformis TaxID=2948575 RepID=UPI0020C5602D|nr:DJ-1/PfpI family protein [Anatilimnocola floriformis]